MTRARIIIRRTNARGAAVAAALLMAVIGGSPGAAAPDLAAEAAAKTFDTEADVVVLREKRTVTLGDDGKVVERVRVVRKIVTDFAMDELCDPPILFNAAKQKLKVIEASATMLDGTRVETGDNGKNLATPEELATFPGFCDVQEMIVSFTGVEVGGVTTLEYEIGDKAPWRTFFYGREDFAGEGDIEEKILELRVPAGRALEWKAYGFKPESTKTTGKGLDVYRFRAAGLGSVNRHEAGSGGALVLPTILWAEKIDGPAMAKAFMGSAYGFGKPMTGDEKAAVEEILGAVALETKGKMISPLDKTLHTYRRVADWMATVEVDRTVAGWEMRPAREAFASGYGDIFEKLGILYSVFSRLGASPVPIVTLAATGDPAPWHPGAVTGAWLKVSANGLQLYLPAGGSEVYGEPRPGRAFVVGKDGLTHADVVKPATTRTRIDVSIDLRKPPYVFSATIKLRGTANPYWSALISGGADPVAIAGEKLAGAPLSVQKASFQRLALDETVVLAQGSVNAAGKELDVSLASPLLGGTLAGLEIWRQGRETPLVIPEKEIEALGITVILPEKGGGVAYIPAIGKEKEEQSFSYEGLPGSSGGSKVTIFRKSVQAEGKIRVARKIILEPGVVPPDTYESFRAALAEALAPQALRAIVTLPMP